jgi:hypothetical protein
VKAKLQGQYQVERAYIVPVSDQVLKKKFNGAAPIDEEDRKALIEALIEDSPEYKSWLKPFYGLLDQEDLESLGHANKEIIKQVSLEFPE